MRAAGSPVRLLFVGDVADGAGRPPPAAGDLLGRVVDGAPWSRRSARRTARWCRGSAGLADVSVEYYAKLERGSLGGVSPAVLEAVARALQFDDAERAHLLHLAQAAHGSDVLTRPRCRTSRTWTPHRSLQWVLDAVTAGPAFVRNGRMDILAANHLARAFYTAEPGSPSEESLRLLASWAATQDVGRPAEQGAG
nr:helix-turn-helix domain-containing protein [Streptomyces sp. NRRL F-5123]